MNNYSAARVMMVADYYRRPMLRMAAVCAVVTAALYLLVTLPAVARFTGFFQAIASTLMSMMFYLGPLVFADENSRQLAVLMPARASEKFTVIALWSFIAVPFVIGATWTVLWIATMWTDTALPVWDLYKSALESHLPGYVPFLYAFRVLQDLIPMVIVMWVVLASRRGIVAKAVLAAIGTLVALGLAGVIIGIFAVYLMIRINAGSLEQLQGARDANDMLELMNIHSDGFVYMAMGVLLGIIVLFELFALWRSYKLVAHRQV